MEQETFNDLLEPFRDQIYMEILAVGDCGPFDGGCVVFANALQSVIGGKIVVLIDPNGRADHAAVARGGLLYDFDGPLPPVDFVERFCENERVTIAGYRPIDANDLPGAVRDKALQAKLSEILRDALSQKPTQRQSQSGN
jgi:hypothetical protein